MTILTAEVTNQTEKLSHNLNPPWTRLDTGLARPVRLLDHERVGG